jgi:hypothetical protein
LHIQFYRIKTIWLYHFNLTLQWFMTAHKFPVNAFCMRDWN